MYKHFLCVSLCGLLLPAQLTAQTQFISRQSVRPEIWHCPDSLLTFPQEDTISWTDEYTVFAVARSQSDSMPECLWSFAENDTITTAVLTRGIYSASVGTLLSRNPRDFSRWCVYAYHSGIYADSTKQRTLRLGPQLVLNQKHAQSDSLSARIEMEEMAYFNGSVPRLTYDGFQTYLALKYGITLDYAPYLSQLGDTLWHPKRDDVYYHRIVGIGNDTVCHWHGTLSQSKEDSLLYIQSDSLHPNEYILLGDDNGTLSWYKEFDNEYALQRTWRMRRAAKKPQPFTLMMHLSALEETTDSLYMQITDIHGATIADILPDSLVGDSVYYFSIHREDTVMHFRFYGVNPHPVLINHDKSHGSPSDNNSGNSNIQLNANDKTLVVKGYPDNQVFTLYLYDNVGKYITNVSSVNPIDIRTLPNTVFYIEIMADNQIVGAINIPVNVL